jgi:hypothetical protein
VRFKKLADLPLDVIGEVIRRIPAKSYIEAYQGARGAMSTGTGTGAGAKAPSKKPAAPAKKPARPRR